MSVTDPIEVTREVISVDDGLRVWEVTNADSGQVVGYDIQVLDA
jgi:hypothetical protein